MPDVELIAVKVAPEFKRRIEAEARRQDRDLSYIVRHALVEYLDRTQTRHARKEGGP